MLGVDLSSSRSDAALEQLKTNPNGLKAPEEAARLERDRADEGAKSGRPPVPSDLGVDLYWLPLGAGGHSVRLNGRIFEAVAAHLARRPVHDLYHSALELRLPEGRYVVELAPVPRSEQLGRGVVAEGAVGSSWAGRFRIFRYEVRCWLGGSIPDLGEAVASPQSVTKDPRQTQRLFDLVAAVPTPVWGRDQLGTGEMWNSNSVISWLIASSGMGDSFQPPVGGRAPGWDAGLVLAQRQQGRLDPAQRPVSRQGRPPDRRHRLIGRIRRPLALGALAGVLVGGVLHLLGDARAADVVWATLTALMLVPLTWSVARTLWRRDLGVDAIALVAMAAALATGEFLAGAVVALMLAGGNALEAYAAGRARNELTKLLERTPRFACRRRVGAVEEVPVDELRPGDIVVVRAGEVIPVDGVAVGEAVVDEAALTGEPMPIVYTAGSALRSGSANAGEAFDLRATRLAAESTYAAIVSLVRAAETQRAPFVRLADRYAALFLPLTLLIAGIAWAASGDAVRFVAVMVVATPCPLILAAPIALIAGVSRAARRGVIVKGSGTIENLGRARTVLFDKTGTLTIGHPALERVVAFDGIRPDELLRLAASVDQLSTHVLAEALVHAAHEGGLDLASPAHVEEGAGRGIEGQVDDRRVAVGSSTWIRERGYSGAEDAARSLDTEEDLGKSKFLVGVDGRLAGAMVMGDSLRQDAHGIVERLRAVGVRHVAMVTGDRAAVAEEVGRQLGVDRVYAERSPKGKLDVVRALRGQPALTPIVMVGDGINDAPALALADVGIAMGAAGATVASETADAVVVRDRIDGVVEAIQIGRRSLEIARQSVIAGIGLSLMAMTFAAAGMITPVAGALLQEVIDVAVIVNALRALRA